MNPLVSPFESLVSLYKGFYWPWVEPMASKTFFSLVLLNSYTVCMYKPIHVHDIDLLINTVEPLYSSHPCNSLISGMIHSQKTEGNITPDI